MNRAATNQGFFGNSYYAGQPNIKEQYNVYGVPVYYVVDPDGFLVQSPTHRPTGKIEEYFAEVTQKRKRGKSFEEVEDYRD